MAYEDLLSPDEEKSARKSFSTALDFSVENVDNAAMSSTLQRLFCGARRTGMTKQATWGARPWLRMLAGAMCSGGSTSDWNVKPSQKLAKDLASNNQVAFAQ